MDIYFYYRVSYLQVHISDIKEKEKGNPFLSIENIGCLVRFSNVETFRLLQGEI